MIEPRKGEWYYRPALQMGERDENPRVRGSIQPLALIINDLWPCKSCYHSRFHSKLFGFDAFWGPNDHDLFRRLRYRHPDSFDALHFLLLGRASSGSDQRGVVSAYV
jgi:hypothetical protein